MAAQPSNPEGIMVEACPECKSSNIHSRMTMTPKYQCGNCGAGFEEAHERAPGADA